MDKTVTELCKSASRALSALNTKFQYAGGMTYEVFTKLYNSLVEPSLYFGAGASVHITRKCVGSVQNTACRYFLGVSKNASNLAVRGDMGLTSCIVKGIIEDLRLHLRIKSLSPDRTVRRIQLWSETVCGSLCSFN